MHYSLGHTLIYAEDGVNQIAVRNVRLLSVWESSVVDRVCLPVR